MVTSVVPKYRSAIETSTGYADISKEHSPVTELNILSTPSQPAVVYSISQSESEDTIPGLKKNVPMYE